MNGLEVLKIIRDKENLIPILMLTAKAEIDDKVEGLDLGANDYLTKPFAAKELLARIRAMIRTQTTQTESILHAGNITLNRATFELASPTGSFRLAFQIQIHERKYFKRSKNIFSGLYKIQDVIPDVSYYQLFCLYLWSQCGVYFGRAAFKTSNRTSSGKL